MSEKKCDYCGKYYEEEFEETLNNGSPACPQCAAEEEKENCKETQEKKSRKNQ